MSSWLVNGFAAVGSLVGKEASCWVVNDLPIDVSVNSYNAVDIINPYDAPYQRYSILPGQKTLCKAANGYDIKLRLHIGKEFSEVGIYPYDTVVKASSLAITAREENSPMKKYAEFKIPDRLLSVDTGTIKYPVAYCQVKNDLAYDILVVAYPHLETNFDITSPKACSSTLEAGKSKKISVTSLGRMWLKVVSNGTESGVLLLNFDDICDDTVVTKASSILHFAPLMSSVSKHANTELPTGK